MEEARTVIIVHNSFLTITIVIGLITITFILANSNHV